MSDLNQEDVKDITRQEIDNASPDMVPMGGSVARTSIDTSNTGVNIPSNMTDQKDIANQRVNTAEQEAGVLQGIAKTKTGIEAAAVKTKQQELADQKTTYDNYVKSAQASYQALQDASNIKVNPRQFIDNMSTGSKVFAGFGMLLAGFGGADAVTKTTNMINQAIQQDIAAQEGNRSAQQTGALGRLKQNNEQFRNATDHFKEMGVENQALTMFQLDHAIAYGQQLLNSPGVNGEKSVALQKVLENLNEQKLDKQNETALKIADHVTTTTQMQAPSMASNTARMIERIPNKTTQATAWKELEGLQRAEKSMENIGEEWLKASKLAPPSSVLGKLDISPSFKETSKQYDTIIGPRMEGLTKFVAGRVTPQSVALLQKSAPVYGDTPETTALKVKQIRDVLEEVVRSSVLTEYGIVPKDWAQKVGQKTTTHTTTPGKNIKMQVRDTIYNIPQNQLQEFMKDNKTAVKVGGQ